MTRATIDYGIDLGTTNSAVAVVAGVDATVIKNNDDADTTPSAVWIDERGRLYVGKAARERNELDPENTCVEFKLRMGTTGQHKLFAASGRTLQPEELSAEVLKSLRDDVRQRIGEEIHAGVITVPAAFGIPACDATRRAAAAAGLVHAPLLQEPTAAALAYGFQTTSDNVFWLAYDLGGGTFDAAVVHVRDGEFTVVKHRGDNFLGGKLIDWRIVEELLVPAAKSGWAVPGLARGNPKWFSAINKLKLAAETAKIRLSRTDSVEIRVDLHDHDGRPFEFSYELNRADVAKMAEPFLERSVNLCRKVLREAKLDPGAIEKVLLVGGPTLAPYVRERLADPEAGLGIALDHSQDPMTVVARGAAIFAGTQRLAPSRVTPAAGELIADLEYRPVGPDLEPLVGGRIRTSDGSPPDGYTIEFKAEDALEPWHSGRVALRAEGRFMLTLWAERGRTNTYSIAVFDTTGARHAVTPDRIAYTVGVTDTAPPLTYAIGVGLHNNEVIWLLERGTPLPARRRVLLRTMTDVRQDGGLIRIPVVEGEHARADRNRRIGRLEVVTEQISRGVPEGSEVYLTVEINASRQVKATAYVPLLDVELSHVLNLNSETVPDPDELTREAQAEMTRLEEVRARAAMNPDSEADRVLDQMDREGAVAELNALLDASKVDTDAAVTAAKRVLDLRAAIDEAEDRLVLPSLINDANDLIAAVRDVINDKGERPDRDALATHEASLRAAIDNGNADLIRQRSNELRSLALRVLNRTGDLPKLAFRDLQTSVGQMGDQAQAASLIERGRQAIRDGDIGTLRNVNRQLGSLLPSPLPPPNPFSTVGRG